jgi:hypothetical protein
LAVFSNKVWRGGAFVLAVSSTTVGCSAGAAPADSGMLSSCATETRAIAYAPNLSRASASGAFTAVLVESDPGPPIKGSNDWTVRILDANGAPVDGLVVTGLPRMPDHTHPTSVLPVVTAKGGGTYDVSPVYLFMPGYWVVTLTLQPAAGAADTVTFPFCIPS